jgi:hypothetical protein
MLHPTAVDYRPLTEEEASRTEGGSIEATDLLVAAEAFVLWMITRAAR